MISIFKKHKNVILFLLKFFATYVILFAIYSSYLQNNQVEYPPKNSGLTIAVTHQTASMLNFLGFDTQYYQHGSELSQAFYVEKKYVVKIVEGCNSISVIILFIAFIVAFSNGIFPTLLYIILGSLLVYTMNLVRLVLLSILLLKYPKQQWFFHDIMFPAIIYGTVFLLWVLWVNKFSKLKR